ncbi:MAG: O-antigen ligase family protein [Candidatus Brocadiia bacterium]
MRESRLALPITAAIMACVAGSAFLVTQSAGAAFVWVVGLYLAGITFFFPRIGLGLLLLMMLFSPEVIVGAAGSREVTVRGDDLIIVLVAMGWLARMARRKEGAILRWSRPAAPILVMSGILIISALSNVLLGNTEFASAVFYTGKRVEYFLVFFMVTSIFRDWDTARWMLYLFLAGCLVVSVIGIYQFMTVQTPAQYGGVTSVFGIGEANTLGGFTLLVIAVSFALATRESHPWLKIGLISLLVFSILCLTFSYSRGAYVALPFAVLPVLFFDRSRASWKQFGWMASTVLFLGTVILLGGVFLSKGFAARVFEPVGRQLSSIWSVFTEGPQADSSMGARWNAWGNALQYFSRHPILGMGPGSRPMGYYDSHWFRELAETGLAGLLTFIWIQISAFRLCLEESREEDSPVQGLALGFMGAQVALWVHAFTASNFYTIRTTEPFFFMLGLVAVGHFARREGENEAAEEETEERAVESELTHGLE